MKIQFESEPTYQTDSPWTMRQYRLVQNKILKEWIPFAIVFYGFPRELHLIVWLFPKSRSSSRCRGVFNGTVGNRPVIEIHHIDAAETDAMMRTFFHEVTHLKQWLFDYDRKDRMFDENSGPYWDRAIEVEAREMADIMVEQFKKYRNNYQNTYRQLAIAA